MIIMKNLNTQMAIGPFVRQMLGPLERPVSELYRSAFVDLTSLVRKIKERIPAANILEVGCGEGAVTERLARAYANAHVTGIDITPRIGRMFQGDLKRVSFKQETIKDFAKENCSLFDLVVISDVIHHVAPRMHKEFLADARKALKPGGYLVLKDWERSPMPIHALCYLLDRYITQDRVQYGTAAEFRDIINAVFGSGHISHEARIRPWSNNIVFFIRV